MESAAQNRTKLYSLLGDLPERKRAISSRTLKTADCGDYVLETLVLDLNGIEEVTSSCRRHKFHPYQ
jgi:hypothetical protein